MVTRTVTHAGSSSDGHQTYSFQDSNGLYSATFKTDLAAASISVNWTKLGSSTGIRVQKTPVFCWSMLESLTASLEQLGPALAAST